MVSISAIIPNYNRAALIGETIENMLYQTLPPSEVIVVDDGSTDDSVHVIRSFGDRVTLIQQPNKGPGAARNTGLKVATGEFIQFMDSDDLASLNKLEVQSKKLIHDHADMVYGPWVKVWMQQNSLKLQDVVLQQSQLPDNYPPLFWFLTSWSMVFQQCLVRKSLLDRIGGYREDMRLYEDGDLFVRMLVSEAKLTYENESLTLYRLEDYGKLTASGSYKSSKVMDQLKFYQNTIQLINQSSNYQFILKHPLFHLNLWQTLSDLQKHQISDEVFTAALNEILQKTSFTQLKMKKWLRHKQQGLQKQFKGHRWSEAYQSGNLTIQQKQLIEELEFCLIR
ncbi:MAG: glycosyltransferase [Oscillatoriales cyanobacterium RM2_1_1]|nr:glycosyltransferase [Oscillatoriales cyanobacterium SM2_3_0]NJO46153.1 glycosyltransferase [Oscillatoriales cyanobacterium RM2_1_1]